MLHNKILEKSGFRELSFEELEAVGGGHLHEELTDEYIQDRIAIQSLTILEAAAATEWLASGVVNFEGGNGGGGEGGSSTALDAISGPVILVLGSLGGGLAVENADHTSQGTQDFCRATSAVIDLSVTGAAFGTAIALFGAGATPFIPDGEVVGGAILLTSALAGGSAALAQQISAAFGRPC